MNTYTQMACLATAGAEVVDLFLPIAQTHSVTVSGMIPDFFQGEARHVNNSSATVSASTPVV